MHGIRKRYVDLNLSSNVVDLVINSWSKGTQKQYSPHINRWLDYCTRHSIDPFDSSVNQGAEFLAEYFHKGVSYSMVNTARSALSKVFPDCSYRQALLCIKKGFENGDRSHINTCQGGETFLRENNFNQASLR